MTKDLIKLIKNSITNALSFWLFLPILLKIKKNDIAIDCGANVGFITKLLANRGARVWSFEPDPYAFDILSKRFENRPNVTCLNKGVWSENSRMKLYFHKDIDDNKVPWSVGSSVMAEKRNINRDNYQEIELIDLSEFLNKLEERVKLIKMDIEGAEIEVLNKLIDTEQVHKADLILVETHETKIPGQLDQLNKLKDRISQSALKNIKLNWL